MDEVTSSESKKKGLSAKSIFIILAILIAAGGYAGAYYYYGQYKATKVVLENPDVASKNEVKEITDKLGKIYALPQDEEPSVATVLDKEKLKDQLFFAKAENGDKVVIYTKSQFAILFRVSENKIINVSPVSLQDQAQKPEAEPEATEKPVVKATEAPAEETPAQ